MSELHLQTASLPKMSLRVSCVLLSFWLLDGGGGGCYLFIVVACLKYLCLILS